MTWMGSEFVMPPGGTTAEAGTGIEELALSPRWCCDPLEPDAVDDEIVVTTTRRILRLAISAADVSTRFSREASSIDPAAWLIAPCRLFEGMAAIDACQELSGFKRSIIVHGLSMALDADPADVDDLMADVADVADHPDASGVGMLGTEHAAMLMLPRTCLFSCWVDVADAEARLFAFCAMVTDRPADLVERIVGRYGRAAAAEARFAVGFDHSTPLATAMVSDAMADTLALAASDPTSRLARGLDVLIEQRFLA